jgi:hypothetical protein
MGRPSKYSPELRERAVRLVFDQAGDHPVAVGSHQVSGGEDRLSSRGTASLGAAGRTRCGPAARPDDG